MTRKPRSHVRILVKRTWVVVFAMEPGDTVVQKDVFTDRGIWELVRHIAVRFSRGVKFS